MRRRRLSLGLIRLSSNRFRPSPPPSAKHSRYARPNDTAVGGREGERAGSVKIENALATTLLVSVLFIVPRSGLAAGPDLESCLNEPLPAEQIACFGLAAITAGDPSLCLAAELPSVRWPCVALYADYADDPSLCGILPASKDVPASVSQDLCHVQLAMARRDPALCEGLATPNLADGCFYQLVESGGDPALCERIANPEVRTVCALDPEKLE